jgi:hypothetical protein
MSASECTQDAPWIAVHVLGAAIAPVPASRFVSENYQEQARTDDRTPEHEQDGLIRNNRATKNRP